MIDILHIMSKSKSCKSNITNIILTSSHMRIEDEVWKLHHHHLLPLDLLKTYSPHQKNPKEQTTSGLSTGIQSNDWAPSQRGNASFWWIFWKAAGDGKMARRCLFFTNMIRYTSKMKFSSEISCGVLFWHYGIWWKRCCSVANFLEFCWVKNKNSANRHL